jgi:hypothetical protein
MFLMSILNRHPDIHGRANGVGRSVHAAVVPGARVRDVSMSCKPQCKMTKGPMAKGSMAQRRRALVLRCFPPARSAFSVCRASCLRLSARRAEFV